jgi:AAA domain
MTLHPTTTRREKILAYGGFNSGKSSMTLALANWRRDTNADFSIYLGDTEHGWEVVDDGGYPFVHHTDLDIEDYRPWVEWGQETKRKVGRDDWLVVDLHKAWEASEIHYFGPLDILAEIAEKHRQFTQGDKGGESMGGAYGGRWAARRRWYNAFHLTVMNAPCHILCVAHAEELREYHSAEVKAKYKVGWKPEGSADLPTMFNTVLYCAETPKDWIYTTVREKGPVGGGRKMLKAEPVEDFVQTYLIPIAGWRP